VSRLGFKKMWDWNDDDAREMRRGYAYARAHAFWSGTPDQNVEKVFVGLEALLGFLSVGGEGRAAPIPWCIIPGPIIPGPMDSMCCSIRSMWRRSCRCWDGSGRMRFGLRVGSVLEPVYPWQCCQAGTSRRQTGVASRPRPCTPHPSRRHPASRQCASSSFLRMTPCQRGRVGNPCLSIHGLVHLCHPIRLSRGTDAPSFRGLALAATYRPIQLG
jgi:hypothetical protein